MSSRSLGISAPKGGDVHEIYLTVDSRPSILGKVTELMGSKNVDILGLHGQVSDDKKTARNIIYVEMKEAKVNIRQLLELLKKQEYILEAYSEPKNRVYFEGFLFPLTSGGHYRVFVLGGEEWMVLVKSLMAQFGSAASSLLYQQGFYIGQKKVESLGSRFQKKPWSKTLFENFLVLFSASGLGRLKVLETKGGFDVVIEDSIAMQSSEKLIDNFLVGVVAGGLGKIYSSNFVIEELRFEGSHIRFRLSSRK